MSSGSQGDPKLDGAFMSIMSQLKQSFETAVTMYGVVSGTYPTERARG